MNLQDRLLLANLSAVTARAGLTPRFGAGVDGACCEDCKKNGTTCGAAPKMGATAIESGQRWRGVTTWNAMPTAAFGAWVDQAPPPPQVGWPFTDDDLKNYAGYVESRVTAMDRAWSRWHDPTKWDPGPLNPNGGGSCSQADLDQLNQKLNSGQITLDQAAAACHPQYFEQMNAANKWSTETVTGGGVGWEGWPAWSGSLHQYTQGIQGGGIGQWIKIQLTGGLFGDYPTLKTKHEDLIRYAAAAVDLGLDQVPDPGTVAAPKSLGEVVNTSPVTGDLVTIATYAALGLVGVYAFTMLSARKKATA